MKHTGTEWYTEENGFIIYLHAGQPIAEACKINGEVNNLSRVANAKLIASAPELLEALQKALEFQNDIRGMGFVAAANKKRMDLRKIIESAIKKATD